MMEEINEKKLSNDITITINEIIKDILNILKHHGKYYYDFHTIFYINDNFEKKFLFQKSYFEIKTFEHLYGFINTLEDMIFNTFDDKHTHLINTCILILLGHKIRIGKYYKMYLFIIEYNKLFIQKK